MGYYQLNARMSQLEESVKTQSEILIEGGVRREILEPSFTIWPVDTVPLEPRTTQKDLMLTGSAT